MQTVVAVQTAGNSLEEKNFRIALHPGKKCRIENISRKYEEA